MRTVIACVVAAVPSLAPLSALTQGPVPMSRLAPANSFVVAEIADFTAVRTAADGSALGELWRDEKVQAFIERVTEDGLKELTDKLARIDAKPEDIKPPTGRVGFALFMSRDAADGAPEEMGPFPRPEFLVVSDFGANSGDVRELIERELNRAKEAGEVELDEEPHDGAIITVVKDPEPGADDPAEPEMGAEARTPDAVFFTWSGTNLLATTHLDTIKGALDALGGRDIDSADDNPVLGRSLRQHPSDPMGYGVLLLDPLAADFKRSMEQSPLPIDPAAILAELGLDRFESVSVGLRSVGGPESLAEFTAAALVPEKKGLVSLFLDPIGGFEPPAFVGPDTSTALTMSFRFDGLIDVLRGAVNTLPEEQRAQASAQFDQAAAMVGPALAQLGPRIQYFVSYDRPLTPEAQRQVFAIQMRDQLPVVNTLTMLAAPIGLEPRDFEGNTIYSGEDSPIAIGLGFAHLFIGPPAAVENAMRSAGNPDAPRLATEPAFRRATAGIPADAILASYADLRRELQWMYYMFQNFDAIQAASLEGMDMDPEQKEELLRGLRESKPEWADHLPPLETLTSRLGFSVYDVRPTPEGFFGRSKLLKPE